MLGRNYVWAILFASVMTLPVGCKRVTELLSKSKAPAGQSAATAESEGPTLGQKMNGYISDCLNVFTENVMRSEEYYFSWAGKEGPSQKTPDVKGVLSTYLEPKRCTDAVSKSNAMAPKDPVLELAASRYANALQALRPVIDKARVYYENRGYKTDQFEEAKELHQKLVQAFGEFDAADQELGIQIDQREDQEAQRSLAAIEKQDGRKFPYLFRATIIQAKAMNRQIQRPWDKLQLSELQKAFAAYDALVKELAAYRDTHRDETRATFSGPYIEEHKTMVRLSRDYMHRVEDKKPFSKDELRFAENAPSKLMNEYNHLVTAFNNLH